MTSRELEDRVSEEEREAAEEAARLQAEEEAEVLARFRRAREFRARPAGDLSPLLSNLLPTGYEWVTASGTTPLTRDARQGRPPAARISGRDLIPRLSEILEKLGKHQRLTPEEATLFNMVVEFPGRITDRGMVERFLEDRGWLSKEAGFDEALAEEDRSPFGIVRAALLGSAGLAVKAEKLTGNWSTRIAQSDRFKEVALGEARIEAQPEDLQEQFREGLAPLSWETYVANNAEAWNHLDPATRASIQLNIPFLGDVTVDTFMSPDFLRQRAFQQMQAFANIGDLSSLTAMESALDQRMAQELADAGYSPQDISLVQRSPGTPFLDLPPEVVGALELDLRGDNIFMHPTKLFRVWERMRQELVNQPGSASALDSMRNPSSLADQAAFVLLLRETLNDPNAGHIIEAAQRAINEEYRTFNITALDGEVIGEGEIEQLDRAADQLGAFGSQARIVMEEAMRRGIRWQELVGVLSYVDRNENLKGVAPELLRSMVSDYADAYAGAFTRYGDPTLAAIALMKGEDYAARVSEIGIPPPEEIGEVLAMLTDMFGDLTQDTRYPGHRLIGEALGFLSEMQNGIPSIDPRLLDQMAGEMWRNTLFRDPTPSERNSILSLTQAAMIEAAKRRSPWRAQAQVGGFGTPDDWQYFDWQPDVRARIDDFLRTNPTYQELYALKPMSMTDDEFVNQFVQRGQDLLGGGPVPDQAILAGMRSGDPDSVRRSLLFSGEGFESSTFRGRIAALLGGVRDQLRSP